jgi:hypothetical protein
VIGTPLATPTGGRAMTCVAGSNVDSSIASVPEKIDVVPTRTFVTWTGGMPALSWIASGVLTRTRRRSVARYSFR